MSCVHADNAAAVNGSVDATVFALVSTSRVLCVSAPAVLSVVVTAKIAELAVGTAASCFVAVAKTDDNDGQTDCRLPTMLSAASAPTELVELDVELDDEADGVTTMVIVPGGTVGTVTLLPPLADCATPTD